MTANMVYDIVLMVLFVYIVWRGWHQGMLSEVLRLGGWVAAAVLIGLYASPWAEKIYHVVMEPRAVSAVTSAIPPDVTAALENGAVAAQSLQEILNSLGGLLGGQILDGDTVNSILSMLRQDPGSLAQAITQTVLQPLLVTLAQVVLSLVMLSVCLFISRALAKMVAARRARRDNILSMTNRLLGLALCIGEGLVTVYVYVFCLSLLALFINTSWFSQDILHDTIFVRLFL